MTGVLVGALALFALAGALMGGRHLYLRMDRPHGITCSLRVARGDLPGLGSRFRAGYAGPELDRMLWRRVAWPTPAVRFPIAGIRLDRERRPAVGERLALPASFSVVPVECADGLVLELAFPRRKLRQVAALLGGGSGQGR